MRLFTSGSSFISFFSNFIEQKVAFIASIMLLLILIIAIFAPIFTLQDPYNLSEITILNSLLSPGETGINGEIFWLGTDDQGRDLLSAIIYGLRISLYVGIISGFFSLASGASLGILGAQIGGKFDAFIMRMVDLFLALPSFLIALILLAVFGRGVDKVILALVLSTWAIFARIARGTTVVEREKDYINAVRCLALPRWRVVFLHLLPNCLPPLIVVGTVNVAFSILLEANLSFLGVGLPITEPSLGLLIANGFEYILTGRYWISFFPGIALLITIASINLVADRLRDILNPRLQK